MKTPSALSLALLAFQAAAQAPDLSQVEITTHALGGNLYYLEGAGGNIGVSVGSDGVVLIDDQYAPLTDRILTALAAISREPVRFLINTHHHPDHTGGNDNLGRAGVVIVAHENVRTLLADSLNGGDLDARNPPQRVGLPVITYADAVTFHLNGEEIRAFHVSPAHTDGDSFVHFLKANVIHTGDVFRTTGYPVVDSNANGSFHGIIEAYETLLDMSDEDTVFLPGHGVPSAQDELREQLDMFHTLRDRVQTGIDAGHSLEEIQAGQPAAQYEDRWGGGRVSGPDLIAVIHQELLEL